MDFERLTGKARQLFDIMLDAKLRLALAESCTGGLVAGAFTSIPGSSDVLDRGFVTYSNSAKSELLHVPASLIDEHGAVSSQVAEAMAAGALEVSQADIAASVTGIAGPGGGSAFKPVGLVWFAVCRRGGAPKSEMREFGAVGRQRVRELAVETSFDILCDFARSA